MSTRVILIGTSAGGVAAVQKILTALPKMFPTPVVIVQHLASTPAINISMAFGPYSSNRVVDVIDKTPILPGHVYFAPAAYHMLIEKDRVLSLSQDDPVNFSRPSIDVLFESAADALGSDACAILMTGASDDGARGIKAIQEAGGSTIVQDPADAYVAYMPQSALKIMKPDFVLTLPEIIQKMIQFSQEVVHEQN